MQEYSTDANRNSKSPYYNTSSAHTCNFFPIAKIASSVKFAIVSVDKIAAVNRL